MLKFVTIFVFLHVFLQLKCNEYSNETSDDENENCLPAVINSASWIISIQIHSGNLGISQPEHHCSGAIIHSNWIVSSEMCIPGNLQYEHIKIVAGTYDIGYNKNQNEQIRFIKKKYFYKRVLLIQLNFELKWNNHVQPIDLPQRKYRKLYYGTIFGWEIDQVLDNEYSKNILLTQTRYLMNSDECTLEVNKYFNETNYEEDNMICTWHNASLNCTVVEFGVPLVQANSDGVVELIGISTGVVNFQDKQTRVVYHKMEFYSNWIRSVINPLF